MIDEIEDLAAVAVDQPVEPPKKPTILELLEKAGKQTIWRRPLDRCPFCQGQGYTYGKLSFLWGHVCWGCGGWGGVDMKHMRLAPTQPHPYRIRFNER